MFWTECRSILQISACRASTAFVWLLVSNHTNIRENKQMCLETQANHILSAKGNTFHLKLTSKSKSDDLGWTMASKFWKKTQTFDPRN